MQCHIIQCNNVTLVQNAIMHLLKCRCAHAQVQIWTCSSSHVSMHMLQCKCTHTQLKVCTCSTGSVYMVLETVSGMFHHTCASKASTGFYLVYVLCKTTTVLVTINHLVPVYYIRISCEGSQHTLEVIKTTNVVMKPFLSQKPLYLIPFSILVCN